MYIYIVLILSDVLRTYIFDFYFALYEITSPIKIAFKQLNYLSTFTGWESMFNIRY